MNTFASEQRSKGIAQTQAQPTVARDAAHHGPHAESQHRLGQLLGGGPRAAAQLRLAHMVQRQEADEEELVQRQEQDDEELVQREEIPDEEEETAQLQPATDEEDLIQQQTASGEDEESLQLKSDRGGLPANLKAGLEGMSGVALDDVKVHYNSPKPSQLHAHAYTQGTEIHVGPGQEKHLPHEAWHAVQQKQGRVQATTQLQGVSVNDDESLEREADVMGAKATQLCSDDRPAGLSQVRAPPSLRPTSNVIQGAFWYRQYVNGPIMYYAGPELPMANWKYDDIPPRLVYYPFGRISEEAYRQKESQAPRVPQPASAFAGVEAPSVSLPSLSSAAPPPAFVPQTTLPVGAPFTPQQTFAPPPVLSTPSSLEVAAAPLPSTSNITFRSLAASLNAWGGNTRMNKEARANALRALEAITASEPRPTPQEVEPIIRKILAAQETYISVSSEQGSGKADQKPRLLSAKTAISEGVRELEGVATGKGKTVLPDGIIYGDDARTVTKQSEDGHSFDIGVHFSTTTGSRGATRGEDAGGSPASAYLREKYGRYQTFVAGHLVTSKAGGPAWPANLAPYTNEFNQGPMRTPEAYAEGLLRSDKVIKYESEVVRFNPGALALILQGKDRELVADKLEIAVTELGLKEDGDPEKIEDWTKEKVKKFFHPNVDGF